jgi:Haem-degrading
VTPTALASAPRLPRGADGDASEPTRGGIKTWNPVDKTWGGTRQWLSNFLSVDTGAHAERLHCQGRSISELGDPQLTFRQGGLVIIKDGVLLGGIGVGGYPSGQRDEDLARVGLNAMHL